MSTRQNNVQIVGIRCQATDGQTGIERAKGQNTKRNVTVDGYSSDSSCINSDIQLSVSPLSSFMHICTSVAILKATICTLFSLVHIKSSSFLTSCVIGLDQ